MGAAEDKIVANKKTTTTTTKKKVPTSTSKFVITPEIAARYGVAVGANGVDARTAAAMREGSNAYTGGKGTDPATALADEYWTKLLGGLNLNSPLDLGGLGADGTGSATNAAGTAAALARKNLLADREMRAGILNQYGQSANTALTDRYNNYLNALNQGNQTATGQINTASQNLMNSLPTTYQPSVTPTFFQPTAVANPYQQYLQSMGANTTDIGNLQQYANATAQNNTNMYQGIGQAQNNIQQNYLNSLRAGAGAQQAAALQTLATNQAGQKAAAQQTYDTSKANILSTLLPQLIANPTKSSASAFNLNPTPKVAKPKAKPKGKGK